MLRILRKSLTTGIVTGQFPPPEHETKAAPDARKKCALFRRSLSIREVDTGSCNACEMEMNALMNPVYDAERYGIRIVASPRHADVLAVTGPVTVNMERALKDAYRSTPNPKVVIALGDCAIDCGVFTHSYAVTGPVERHVPVDVKIPGCPPRPSEILDVLTQLLAPSPAHPPEDP